jgi:hypothetical protein
LNNIEIEKEVLRPLFVMYKKEECTLAAKVATMKCSKCNKPKKLSNYYTHRDNTVANLHDFWCKSCVQAYVVDKSTMQSYCGYNNRRFQPDLWTWAETYSNDVLSKDVEFNSLNKKEQEKKLLGRTINSYFSKMNMSQWYSYEENNISEEFRNDSLDIDLEDDEPITKKKEKKVYSSKWGGTFSHYDLNWLEDQYMKSQRDYELKTETDHGKI